MLRQVVERLRIGGPDTIAIDGKTSRRSHARSKGRGPLAQTILDGGGNYALVLKQNRPATYTEVEALFAVPPPSLTIGVHRTIDGGHGRIETRMYSVHHDVDWLFSDRRYPGEPAFHGLAMIGMVESRTERDGKIEQERRYYLCSTKLDPATFARAVRSHWEIENRLHWMLDVVFRDDLARLRTAHGPVTWLLSSTWRSTCSSRRS